jgi:hypothetical protein
VSVAITKETQGPDRTLHLRRTDLPLTARHYCVRSCRDHAAANRNDANLCHRLGFPDVPMCGFSDLFVIVLRPPPWPIRIRGAWWAAPETGDQRPPEMSSRSRNWLVPAQGVPEEQAVAAITSATVVVGSFTGMSGRSATGSLNPRTARGCLIRPTIGLSAPDTRSIRKSVRVSGRASPTTSNRPPGGQQARNLLQGPGQVQVMQDSDHGDQVEGTVVGRRREVRESSPVNSGPGVHRHPPSGRLSHGPVRIHTRNGGEASGQFSTRRPSPQPISSALRRCCGRLRRTHPWKCSL